MRVLIQRSKESEVLVSNKSIGKIDQGLVVFVGFTEGDSANQIDYLVKKILNLRIFDDENGIMNKSILDTNGKILSVSQFTLYGDATKGNRPSYIKAMNGEKAIELYDEFNRKLSEYVHVETGKFGAEMMVQINNDGPVTIWIEKEA